MKKLVDVNSFYEYWEIVSKRYSKRIALKDDYLKEQYTFSQTFSIIKAFAMGLRVIGLQKGEHISLFSENNARWMIADQAIFFNGMISAVRGSNNSTAELEFIFENSDSSTLIVENLALLKKLENIAKKAKSIIYLSKENYDGDLESVYSFEQILNLGKDEEFIPTKTDKDALATLIYTSGTTGFPKGVMLSQKNLLSQVRDCYYELKVNNGYALCMLPIWHAYERTLEYYLLSQGASLAYTNLKNFKDDLTKYQPRYFITVPRVWSAIYEGINKKIAKMPIKMQKIISFSIKTSLKYKEAKRIFKNCNVGSFYPSFSQRIKSFGIFCSLFGLHFLANMLFYSKIRAGFSSNFEFGISGGGALLNKIDLFFDAIEMKVLNGYGLTEASPVVGVRRTNNDTIGSIGHSFRYTQIKIIDKENNNVNQHSQRGVLHIKGPQVMLGYYKNEEATKACLSEDGWLNTGDIAFLSPNGSIILNGREKDTIVLSNGENIEPQGIEDICLTCPLISQMVLIGQDRQSLGALVVPAKKEEINKELEVTILKEIQKLNESRKNYMSFERISKIKLIEEEFTLENGLLTNTTKVRRNKVFEKYNNLIEEIFS